MRIWVEKTLVRGSTFRSSGAFEFGRYLISPKRNAGGVDIYRFMREIVQGDIVLHLTDNEAFTAISAASASYVEVVSDFETWYQVPLTGFTTLLPPLDRLYLFQGYREPLLDVLVQGHKNLFYNRLLRLMQGTYLSPVPDSLATILNEAYTSLSGKPLFSEKQFSI